VKGSDSSRVITMMFKNVRTISRMGFAEVAKATQDECTGPPNAEVQLCEGFVLVTSRHTKRIAVVLLIRGDGSCSEAATGGSGSRL
jgi:hypothetical protein